MPATENGRGPTGLGALPATTTTPGSDARALDPPGTDVPSTDLLGPDLPGAEGWRPAAPRLAPALIVVGIVAVVVIGGVLLAALGSTKAAPPSVGRSAAGLTAERATHLLSPITAGGVPPVDVVGALVVPVGSVRNSTADDDAGVSTYDRSATFSVAARPSDVVTFFTRELHSAGWSRVTVDAAAKAGSTQLFATRAGSDGNYWQVGIRIDQIDGSLSGALAGASPEPTSTFVMRLEQVDDES